MGHKYSKLFIRRFNSNVGALYAPLISQMVLALVHSTVVNGYKDAVNPNNSVLGCG